MPVSNATVIPVAAGKGGVGKTQIAANLAIALAQAGEKTIVVDLDLGGSNLHTHLGLPNRNPGLGDYLRARKVGRQDTDVEAGRAEAGVSQHHRERNPIPANEKDPGSVRNRGLTGDVGRRKRSAFLNGRLSFSLSSFRASESQGLEKEYRSGRRIP